MRAAGAQLEAIREWGSIPSTDRYAMLPRIYQRTLIVHGSKDIVVTPINAFLLAQHLPDAQLVNVSGCQSRSAIAARGRLSPACTDIPERVSCFTVNFTSHRGGS